MDSEKIEQYFFGGIVIDSKMNYRITLVSDDRMGKHQQTILIDLSGRYVILRLRKGADEPSLKKDRTHDLLQQIEGQKN